MEAECFGKTEEDRERMEGRRRVYSKTSESTTTSFSIPLFSNVLEEIKLTWNESSK